MVFDKTGTLTEDGMEILGVQSATGSTGDLTELKFTKFASSIRELTAAS
jgi:magnesium-transporting ATPase (P-type)